MAEVTSPSEHLDILSINGLPHSKFNPVQGLRFLSSNVRERKRDALAQILAPEYVDLAFQLPEACTTIWRIVQDDITRIGAEDPFNTDLDAFLTFLCRFFSEAIVQNVEENLYLCTHSFLGSHYAFRRGKVALAYIIVDDLVDSYVAKPGLLYGFIGATELNINEAENRTALQHGDEWYTMDRRGRIHVVKSDGSSSSGAGSSGTEKGVGDSGIDKGEIGSGGIGRGGGAGRGGRGGRNVPLVQEDFGAPFRSMQVIHVLLPKLRTPSNKTQGKAMTLKMRSFLFKSNGRVRECKPYDPTKDVNGMVNLYHGTRTSSLLSFQRNGIFPDHHRTEFCCQEAFYLTNSLAHAYEHPLHNHLSSKPDPISVLVFRIDVEVLHGDKAPDGGKFSVLWFEDISEMFDKWHEFVTSNMWGPKKKRTHYDIVIGPACIPHQEDATVSKRTDRLENDISLTQLAFCSERAREWLGRQVTKVYCEQRESTSASAE